MLAGFSVKHLDLLRLNCSSRPCICRCPSPLKLCEYWLLSRSSITESADAQRRHSLAAGAHLQSLWAQVTARLKVNVKRDSIKNEFNIRQAKTKKKKK